LLKPSIAQDWSAAVLRTLGLNLDRQTKNKLADALPDTLGAQLKRAYWLLHFRNKNQTAREFLYQVARRSGNSDVDFARLPTQAVFHELKSFAGEDVTADVADALAPEVRELWQRA
jgi:uncharacterized protein (DUF2267 family)